MAVWCMYVGNKERVEAQIPIGFKWDRWPIMEKKISFKNIKEKWMKQFPPKDILPLFLFPLANSALSYMQLSSLFSVREILMQRSLAQTENILTFFPKVNVSIEPTHQLETTVREPTPAFSVANWMMHIADKLGRTGHFTAVSCRVSDAAGLQWCACPRSCCFAFPSSHSKRWGCSILSASAWKKYCSHYFKIMINNRRRNINISSGFVTSVLLGGCLD